MISCLGAQECNGGIAQLARAIGSYPIGRGFKSNFRYHFGPLVKRLRHGPFTAVTWVRFPYGSPKQKKHLQSRCFFCFAIRTQFDHAPRYLADGFASSAQSDIRLRDVGKPKDIAEGKFPYSFASAMQMLLV